MKAPIVAILSGTVWTVIAALILWQPEFWGRLHEIRWLACIAGPFIGLGIYYCSRWSYKKKTAIRIFWAFASLYIAVGAYVLVLGLLAWRLPWREHHSRSYLRVDYGLLVGHHSHSFPLAALRAIVPQSSDLQAL